MNVRVSWLLLLAACGSSSAGDDSLLGGDANDGADAATASHPDASPLAGDAATVADAMSSVSDASPSPDAPATGCTGQPLCDDFESDATGTPPSGWTVVMGCNPNMTNSAVDGGGVLVGVDGSEHHSGSRSVRVVGGDSCGYYVVSTAPFSSLGTDVYARFWVMFSAAPTPNHNGFLSMATAAGDHLRLGFQDDVVAWNAQMSDATLPDMDPQGTTLSVATMTSTWQCIEFHIDETTGYLQFWLDGQAVAGLGYQGQSTQGINDQWSRGAPSPLVPASLGLGWLGLNNQLTVWFDDVALGNARIGCQ